MYIYINTLIHGSEWEFNIAVKKMIKHVTQDEFQTLKRTNMDGISRKF